MVKLKGQGWEKNKSVYEASGQINCLLYIKSRKSRKQNWGITKTVVDRLKKPWFVLLISPITIPSYMLTSDEVDNYIRYRKLNDDGDYKTSPTLPGKNEFTSLRQLKNKIEKIIKK